MCAGIDHVSMRCETAAARTGRTLSAVLGLGGLGHLGVQFCHQDGVFHVIGHCPRQGTKNRLARKLGASVYIDSVAQDPAAELQKLGGAKVILADGDQRRCDERRPGRPGRQRQL